MDYLFLYNSLIDKRKKNPICDKWVEIHHILPKCCGGKDNKNNLVNLTYREHYIAHLLLYKIYKDTEYCNSLLLAINKMCNNRKFKYNSRLYSIAKNKLRIKEVFKQNGKNGGSECWKKHKEILKEKISKSLSKTYICNICGTKVISSRKFHKHIQEYHRNTCYYCKKEFNNYRIKNAHMLHCKLHPKFIDNYKKIGWKVN